MMKQRATVLILLLVCGWCRMADCVTGCASWEKDYEPAEDNTDEAEEEVPPPPMDDEGQPGPTSSSGSMSGSRPLTVPNSTNTCVEFNLYVALRPESRSIGHHLEIVQAVILNVLSKNEYRFHIPQHTGDYQQQELLDNAFAWKHPRVELFLQPNLHPKVVACGGREWWWRYDFRYMCFWPGTPQVPIDAANATQCQQDVDSYLQQAMQMHSDIMDLLQKLGYHASKDFRIQLTPPDEGDVSSPVDYSPSMSPSPTTAGIIDPPVIIDQSTPDPSDTMPFPHTPSPVVVERAPPAPSPVSTDTTAADNLENWNWRRYLGLCLLLGTVTGTICLAQLADLRRNRRKNAELWGNLATEEGVNELLRTGWKIRDSTLEVYQKEDHPPRHTNNNNNTTKDHVDDDAILPQYEHKTVVGSEISITPTISMMTPP